MQIWSHKGDELRRSLHLLLMKNLQRIVMAL